MLDNVQHSKQLSFKTVLMDSWYGSMQVIKRVESLNKRYYCPIKANRRVDDSEGEQEHRRVDQLHWTHAEQQAGKAVHLRKMPKGHRVKLFRELGPTGRALPVLESVYLWLAPHL